MNVVQTGLRKTPRHAPGTSDIAVDGTVRQRGTRGTAERAVQYSNQRLLEHR